MLIFKNALAYKHYQKMPNLFVPAGFYLHPNLRRDQLRKLLCEDQSQVVWLEPAEKQALLEAQDFQDRTSTLLALLEMGDGSGPTSVN